MSRHVEGGTADTTGFMTQVAEQLETELGNALVTPMLNLLGQDLAWQVGDCIHGRVWMLAHSLVQEDDDRLSAQVVIDIMCTLWPHADPDQIGRADWWSTPLGQIVARSAGREDAESVSRSVAAAMLRVSEDVVAQMLRDGRLDRHPDGGVLRGSVLQRIGQDSR